MIANTPDEFRELLEASIAWASSAADAGTAASTAAGARAAAGLAEAAFFGLAAAGCPPEAINVGIGSGAISLEYARPPGRPPAHAGAVAFRQDRDHTAAVEVHADGGCHLRLASRRPGDRWAMRRVRERPVATGPELLRDLAREISQHLASEPPAVA